MVRVTHCFVAGLLSVVLCLAGCGDDKPQAPTGKKEGTPTHTDHDGHDHKEDGKHNHDSK